MGKYQLLLLDADGTLFDFDLAEMAALRMACEAMHLSITDQQMECYQEINRALWRAFERKEVTQEALRVLRFSRFMEAIGAQRDAAAMAEEFVSALSMQVQEIDGALDFVREAARRVPLVVVTNGIASVQRSRFARSPMGQYIFGHVISGEMGFAKPDPRMVYHAMAIGGFPNGRALLVGDEPASDIAAANAAGIDSCWFNPSGRSNETPHAPTHQIRALKEVMQWL